MVGALDISGADDLLHLLSLFFLPFLHEDVAIALGAYLVSTDDWPVSVVAVALYAGIVVSDIALFGLGVAARHFQILGRIARNDRISEVASRLLHNVYWLLGICRVVPGMAFIACVACGWSGMTLRRFTLASIIVSAVYLPVMLYLALMFGKSVLPVMGAWTWPLLFLALLSFGLLRKRIFPAHSPLAQSTVGVAPAAYAATPDHAPLSFATTSSSDSIVRAAGAAPVRHAVARAETIPPVLFYAPLTAAWLAQGVRRGSLTLPACANPMIVTGGMWGESKMSYFEQVAPSQQQWLATSVAVQRTRDTADLETNLADALARIAAAGIPFPLVAKPDIGWHGYGVRIVHDAADVRAYLADYPPGATIVFQRLVPYPSEAAVLYARLPGEPVGRIESVTLRGIPHVVGDGYSDLRTLIETDPRARWKSRLHLGRDATHLGRTEQELARVPASGEIVQLSFVCNQRAGGVYREAPHLITPELSARIDGICRSMPEFHYGRLDIRFASIPEFAEGEAFSVVEINGIGGEAIDAWDPNLTIKETYRRLLRQQALLFEIGARNRARGYRPPGALEFLGPAIAQSRLIGRYPASQ